MWSELTNDFMKSGLYLLVYPHNTDITFTIILRAMCLIRVMQESQKGAFPDKIVVIARSPKIGHKKSIHFHKTG